MGEINFNNKFNLVQPKRFQHVININIVHKVSYIIFLLVSFQIPVFILYSQCISVQSSCVSSPQMSQG